MQTETNFTTEKPDLAYVEQVMGQLANQVRGHKCKHEMYKKTFKKFEAREKMTGRMVHDIQAPLSCFYAMLDSMESLPSHYRILLRSAITDIFDITNPLLNSFNPKHVAISENNKRQPVLVSTILSDLINTRQYKYKNRVIEFECNLNKLNAFLCIKAIPSDLKRAISNLINNAVESLPDTGGKIQLKLKANDEWVYISIFDNGKGMSADTLNKIKKSIGVTKGKKNGHGIGLAQVRDMLEQNHGKFEIESSTHAKCHGTTVTLSFPKITPPHWLVSEINLTKDDTIIIVDEDKATHDAWDAKLVHILEKIPSIEIKHFMSSDAVISFISSLPKNKRQNLCLLSNHDTTHELNSLQLIKICKTNNAILMTNHASNSKLGITATENRIKILPKGLISAISFNLKQKKQVAEDESVNVHMVLVDNEEMSTQTLVAQYYSDLIVDTYSNPFEFLDCVAKYSKDTKIILDNYFYASDGSTYKIDGVSIAKKLHEFGYTNLFLLSGEEFVVPDYLTLILKSDREKIKHLDKL